jgi:hypothetical protein
VCDDTWSRTCAKDNQKKNLFGCDFKLQSRIVKQTRFIKSQDFASCGRIVVRTFPFVSGVGVALKNFHYRIEDPTVLSGGWLGVRQVTSRFFFCIHRFGSPLKSERSRSQHLGGNK